MDRDLGISKICHTLFGFQKNLYVEA
ncbi:hypothetical protein BRAS3809_7040003 [Bradyrhizobium sp. STM 3809]|nr:hypothetical protein BRAS3809_7040003 [Bradyrhizobium sp. STM 3809]